MLASTPRVAVWLWLKFDRHRPKVEDGEREWLWGWGEGGKRWYCSNCFAHVIERESTNVRL